MSHNHKWQFAGDYNSRESIFNQPKDTFRFVCECGKYKFVERVRQK